MPQLSYLHRNFFYSGLALVLCCVLMGWPLEPDSLQVRALLCALAGGVIFISIARSLGMATALLFTLAVTYYLYWLFYHPNGAYTNDVEGHVGYTKYLRRDIFGAFSYYGTEFWHPPTYYALAALWLGVAEDIFHVEFYTALRLLALCMYIVFCVFSVKTLRLYIPSKNVIYYMGCLLILFWPAGILMATRITNDVLLYMGWSVFFYYFARWALFSRDMDLVAAVMLAGLCLMIKLSAGVLLIILGIYVAARLLARQTQWRVLMQPWMLAAYTVVLGGIFVSHSRSVAVYVLKGYWGTFLGAASNAEVSSRVMMNFDILRFIKDPYIGTPRVYYQPDIFTYFTKSLLYGQFHWSNPAVASIINILFLLLLSLTLLGLAVGIRSKELGPKNLMPLLLATVFSYLLVVSFYVTKTANQCMDARFVFPVLVPLVILFTQATTSLRTYAHSVFYWLALATGFGLAGIGTMHYLSVYLKGLF